MKYNGVIEAKLRVIENKLAEIRSWEIDSYEKLTGNSMLHHATERALQIAVEVLIDISERILALENQPPQNTAAGNIRQLQALGIIQQLTEYEDMVKFRNYMVHRYDRVDSGVIYSIVKNKLFLFESFVEDIRKSFNT